jgi:hypothetical protein
MNRCSRTIGYAVLSIAWFGAAASADTLRCRSVNGNINCAGSGGRSCQTVDGKTVCTSGHGDVVQTFGNGTDNAAAGGDGLDDDPPVWRGHRLLPEGKTTHPRPDWLPADSE